MGSTPLLITLEIDGIKRFPTPGNLISWAGLCPTVHQSGKSLYHGKMKKDSNGRVNWMLTQAALVAIRMDSRMKIIYEKAKKTHISNCTITCIKQIVDYTMAYATEPEAI